MQQDYLVRQAEQMGQALALILSKLSGLKNQPKEIIDVSEVNHIFDEKLDFNMDDLLAVPKENLVGFLQTNKEEMNDNNLEALANILAFLAKETDLNIRKQLCERSLAIFEYLDVSDRKTYSFYRRMMIEELKSLINLQV